MHFTCMLVTKEFPTDEVIENKLNKYAEEPYYEAMDNAEDVPVRPLFMYDYYRVGGRAGGELKLKFDYKDNQTEYRWMYFSKEPRAGRLFRCGPLESMGKAAKQSGYFWHEEDYYPYMGSRDGYLYVDGAKIADLLEQDNLVDNSYVYVGWDGAEYAREEWTGETWEEDDQYEEKVKKAMENSQDCYVCMIDMHD